MEKVDMEFDEKAMIREQERLEKEKKRAKNKKIRRIVFLVILLVICGVVGFMIWRSKTAGQEEVAVEIKTEVGQEIVIAKISRINGNEITYVVGEEMSQREAGGRPDMGQMPEGMERPEMGEMPEGMERPEMGEMPEGMEMPNMGEMPDMSEMPQGMTQGRGQDRGQGGGPGQNQGNGNQEQPTDDMSSEDRVTYEGVTYRIGEESITTYIPVGTVVTTKLGTETTFSRLAAGDYVALVVEGQGKEQVIMAVYIIG